MAEFSDYTAKVKDRDGNESESTVSARVSKGAETVVTLTGERVLYDGDVVLRDGASHYLDVLAAEDWAKTGYAKGVAEVTRAEAVSNTGTDATGATNNAKGK